MRYLDESGQDVVFQVLSTPGLQPTPIATFISGYKILEEYEFNLTEEQSARFQAFFQAHQAVTYSYSQLLGIGLSRLFHFKINPLNNNPSAMVCAELLLLLMQTLPDVFPGEESIKVDPTLVGLKVLHDFVAGEPNAVLVKS
jgi:hypothetical protein